MLDLHRKMRCAGLQGGAFLGVFKHHILSILGSIKSELFLRSQIPDRCPSPLTKDEVFPEVGGQRQRRAGRGPHATDAHATEAAAQAQHPSPCSFRSQISPKKLKQLDNLLIKIKLSYELCRLQDSF